MEVNRKIHLILVIVVTLGIILFAVLATLSNNAFAQTLHNQTLYESANKTSGSHEIPQIAVGKSPRAIAFDSTEETIYVANLDSNTVSVISTENNTKIKDIPEIYP